jgi:heme/copper-type cytochrome/quinol oxidase subunit 2
MAELHVQRKRNNYLWLWVIVILIVLFIAGLFIYNRYNHRDQVINTKQTSQIQTNFSFIKSINDV